MFVYCLQSISHRLYSISIEILAEFEISFEHTLFYIAGRMQMSAIKIIFSRERDRSTSIKIINIIKWYASFLLRLFPSESSAKKISSCKSTVVVKITKCGMRFVSVLSYSGPLITKSAVCQGELPILWVASRSAQLVSLISFSLESL